MIENRFSIRFQVWSAPFFIGCFFLVLLLAGYGVPSANAQGLGGLRNAAQNFTRPVVESVRAIIRPTLGIVRNRAGAVTGLHLSNDQSLMFVVLDDGTVRLWDLKRGVQLGDSVGNEIVSGSFRNAGAGTEAVGIRRDGILVSLRTNGSVSKISEKIQNIDLNIAPVISGDSLTVVYRAAAGNWYWKQGSIESAEQLRDATHEMRPILSEDGKKIVYRTNQGRLVAGRKDGGTILAVEFDGCSKNKSRVTAGVFTPDGDRVVLGDEEGNVCVWHFPDSGDLRNIFTQKKAYPEAVHLLVISRDGKRVALGGNHSNVLILSLETHISRLTSMEIGMSKVRSLLIDAKRGWVFAGGRNGTISIYSLKEKMRLVRLISMKRGWAIIDRKGRFDGSQNGFSALVWAGETDAETLSIEAFSDSYFEPGLLVKLDDTSPGFLNENIRDLSEEGYYSPPVVSIAPLHRQNVNAQGRLPVKIRVSPEYTWDVEEIRLYHNGKLVSSDQSTSSQNNKIFEYSVRARPGENTFVAIGIGPEGIEGQPASFSVMLDASRRRQSKMQVVSVGIQEYGPPALKLDYSRADAEAIADTLREWGEKLFHSISADTLLDSSAGIAAIEKHIVQDSASQEDVLVVFLAGHGYALKEDSGWEWYFLPYTPAWARKEVYEEMIKDSSSLANGIRKYGLSSRKLMDFITKTEQQRVFLILDSCRSGAIVEVVSGSGMQFNDSAGQKALHRIARVGGIHILAATRADELAAELISVPHGALTYLVLQGMRGDADGNRDDIVSVREVVEYATREMPLLSQRFTEDIRQNAVGYSRGSDFSIVRSGKI